MFVNGMSMFPSPVQSGIFLYAACSVSVAPLRRDASHRAEQTSQILFGERAEVLLHNEESGWAYIRCAWDSYEGWCKMSQLRVISIKEFRKAAKWLSSGHDGMLEMPEGQLWVPMGSELTGVKGIAPEGETSAKFRGKKLQPNKQQISPEALLEAAFSFLHAPYQWGGRTWAGIDCSGLIQMAFKHCGFPVLRDAAQQADMGEEIHFLAEAEPGDVAFFDNVEGRIIHVGLLADKQNIIHATDAAGRVVHDRIDNAGIISVSLKKRTHNLRMIRRIGL